MTRSLRRAARVVATLVPCLPIAVSAQARQSQDSAGRAVPLAAVTTTATRTVRSTFDTPQPITVIDSATLREKLPDGPIDLFRDVAGLDANGVGPNQRRPEIRLQRGQRILLLEDGLRLNNARRQQDFGELPALAGASVERVDVVRGPSSVLYGTDAIGGVVNIITTPVPHATGARGTGPAPALDDVFGRFHGDARFLHGSAGASNMPTGTLSARWGKLGVRAGASYRDAADYSAPKGTFGDITLDHDVTVFDSGVRDRSYNLALGYDLPAAGELFARAEVYSAERAGFGWIDPDNFGPNQPTIRITYPDQRYQRYTMGYRAGALATPFFNRIDVSGYWQGNKRHFNNFVFVPITPTANVTSESFNFTDLATVGARVELARPFGPHVLTYGVDGFRDHSETTDTSMTTVVGFGPTSQQASNVPNVPNAVFRSVGAFAQAELNPAPRFTAVLGARAQNVFAETLPTEHVTRPLVKGSRSTAVWTANALYRVTRDLNLITAVGRGFRAPNLVERFFEGSAPEGNGFQRAAPDLAAETSVNVDLGARVRHGAWFAEAFAFRNDIHDAIRAVATGNTVNGQPEFQNRNIERLRVNGVEFSGGLRLWRGLDASVNFTRLDGTNVSDPAQPIGDSYSSKLVGDLGYREPSGRFSVGYTARRQGEQKDVIVGTNPIGAVIPAFLVHGARASVRLPRRGGVLNTLSLTVDNIGNTLYAEFPNASFFRPEPGRSMRLSLSAAF